MIFEKTKLLLVLMSLLSVACTGGEKAAIQKQEAAISSAQKTQGIAASNFSAEEQKQFDQIQSLLKVSDDAQLLRAASSLFFDFSSTGVWQNTKLNSQTDYVRLVDRFNLAIVNLYASKSPLLQELQIWSKYQAMLDVSCRDSKNACLVFDVLKLSPRSSEVFNQMAMQKSQVEEYYRILGYSLDIQNRTYSNASAELYVKRFDEYRRYLNDGKRSLELEKATKVFQMFLAAPEFSKKAELFKNLGLLNSYRDEELALAAEFLFRTDEMTQAIKTSQADPNSFVGRRDWVLKLNPKILEKLKVSNLPLDESFFLVDQILNGRLSPNQGVMMATKGKIEAHTLIDSISNRLRFEVVYLMVLNQKSIQDFALRSKGLQISSFKSEMQRDLSRPMTEARALRGRVSVLSQLTDLISTANHIETKDLTMQILNLDRSLKSALSYPALLSLYYLSFKAGLTAETIVAPAIDRYHPPQTFRGVIKKLFQGQNISPFEYSLNNDALNSFETLEAMQLAFQTDLFQSMGFSVDELLANLFEMATAEEMTSGQGSIMGELGPKADLESKFENLKDKYSSPDWNELLSTCSDFEKGQPHARELAIRHLIISPTLGYNIQFLNDEYTGNEIVNIDNQSMQKPGYFSMSRAHVTELEIIRSDLLLTIRFFQNLKSGFEKGDSTKLVKLEEKLEYVKEKTRSFLRLILQRQKEFDSCYFQLIKRDRVIMAQLLKTEAVYWRAAHQEMKKMRADQNYQSPMNQKPISYELPQGVVYRSRISGQSVVNYDFDVLLRMKEYLESGAKWPGSQREAIDPSLKIVLTEEIAKTPEYKNALTQAIPFIEDEDKFVMSAMRSGLYSGKNAVLPWYLGTVFPIVAFQNYYDGHALLYRMSPVVTEILGMPELESSAELFEIPQRVLQFFNLEKAELEALNLTGATHLYDFKLTYKAGLYLNSKSSPSASEDYMLQVLSQKWMGTYGDKDMMENPEVLKYGGRPPAVVPVETIAQNYFNYRSDTHRTIFAQDLNDISQFDTQYRDYINADFVRTAQFKNFVLQNAQSRAPLMIHFDLSGPQKMKLFTDGAIDNVDSVYIQFKKRTGNFFDR